MKLSFHLDHPTPGQFSRTDTFIAVAGWFVDHEGWPALECRLRLGRRLIACACVARPDVGEALGAGRVKNPKVGFAANFTTKPGLKLIRFEFKQRDGHWISCGSRLLRVTSAKSRPPAPVAGRSSRFADRHARALPPTPRLLPSMGATNAVRLPVSIIMPTYNRAGLMSEVVRRTHEICGGYVAELIVVNDGSTDNTEATLRELAESIPSLRFVSTPNGGAGNARNLGASLARHEVVLFMGDDILPANEDFLRPHAELHAENATRSLAVLGKVVWPDDSKLQVNAVMRHIQGRGGEQFGYSDFEAGKFYDWRFFYTCNVSVKRNLVNDWLVEGFSKEFKSCGFEDSEFAYRMSKRLGKFENFYAPVSIGFHLHSYTVNDFIRRQTFSGAMGHTFGLLHPEVLPHLGLAGVQDAARKPIDIKRPDCSADYLAILEGLKAWARLMERQDRLGHEVWHDELLFAVFESAYLQGFLSQSASAETNFENALSYILGRLKLRLGRIIDAELRADADVRARILGLS